MQVSFDPTDPIEVQHVLAVLGALATFQSGAVPKNVHLAEKIWRNVQANHVLSGSVGVPRIEAIKLLRDQTKLSLKESKDLIDAAATKYPYP